MPRISANTIELFYESFGSASAPTVLLIMGLGAQLTRWNIELCDLLVHRGYRVIRFDNRDSGLSTRCDGLALPDFSALLRGDAVGEPAYARVGSLVSRARPS